MKKKLLVFGKTSLAKKALGVGELDITDQEINTVSK
jgi:hypothetical protein